MRLLNSMIVIPLFVILFGSCLAFPDSSIHIHSIDEEHNGIRKTLVTSGNTLFLSTHKPTMYALDYRNGTIDWTYTSKHDSYSSPAVFDKYIVFAASHGYHDNWRQRDRLIAADNGTGKIIWKKGSGGYYSNFISSPLIYCNRVYYVTDDSSLGSTDSWLHAVDLARGKSKWSFKVSNRIGRPLIEQDIAYFGTADGDFYAVDATDGSLKWKFKSSDQVWCKPFKADNRIFFGSFDDHLYCLDACDGSLLWSYKTTGDVFSPVLISNIVYVGTRTNELLALSASNGELLWRFEKPLEDIYGGGGFFEVPPVKGSRGRGFSDILVHDGMLISQSIGSSIVALDAETGEMIWQHTLDPRAFHANPILIDDTLVVPTSPVLLQLDPHTGQEK